MKHRLFILLCFIVSFIAIIPLFHSGLPVTDDSVAHVARIASFYQNLREGNIIPRWAGNLNFGYGHPVLEFFYPLSSYFASFFHFLGFSLITSTKIVFGIGMTLSGIGMFLWLNELVESEAAAVGAFIYMYAPYRIYDLYGRGDIGENTAFAFMPIVLFFLYKYVQTKKVAFGSGFSIALAMLILSHNVLSLIYMPFIIFYAFYLVSNCSRLPFLFQIGFHSILGFGLAAFFWVPAIGEAPYTYRDAVTVGTYVIRAIPLTKMFFTLKDLLGLQRYNIIELGFLDSLLLGYAFFRVLVKGTYSFFLLSILVYWILALFFISPAAAPLAEKIPLLRNIQYPWRLFAVPVFCASVTGAVCVKSIPQKYLMLTLSLSIVTILFFSRNFWPMRGYILKPDSYFTFEYNDSTNSSGESAPIWSKGKTAQIWLVQSNEKRPKAPLVILSGSAFSRQIRRTTTDHKYAVTVFKKATFLENTLYFPGWSVFTDTNKAAIQFQNPRYPGLITFTLEKGNHIVDVTYTETPLRRLADIVSFISALTTGIILLLSVCKRVTIALYYPIVKT